MHPIMNNGGNECKDLCKLQRIKIIQEEKSEVAVLCVVGLDYQNAVDINR